MAIRPPIQAIGKSTIIYGFGNVLSKLAVFFLIPVYTRFLPMADVGIIALLEMLETLLIVLIPFGINNAVWRFLSQAGEIDRKRIVVSAYSGSLILNVLILGLIAAVHRFPASFMGLDVDRSFLFLIVLLNVFLAFGTRFFLALLQYDEKRIAYVAYSTLEFFGILVVTVVFVVFNRWGLFGVLVAKSAVSGTLFLLSGLLILHSNRVIPSVSVYKRLLKFAAPLILLALVAPVLTVSDRFFLNLFVSLEEIAVYAIAYKFGMLINMFLVIPLQRGWAPMMYRLGVGETSHEYHRDILFYYGVLGAMFFLAISFFAKDVITLAATQEYAQGARVVPLVSLAYLLSGFRQFFMAGAAVENRTPRLALAGSVSIIANLALNYTLIKHYGIVGAAWATLFSYLFLTSMVYVASQRVVPIEWNWSRLGKLMFTMLVAFSVAAYAQSEAPEFRRVFGVLGLVLFIILLGLTRTIASREINGIKHLVSKATKRIR